MENFSNWTGNITDNVTASGEDLHQFSYYSFFISVLFLLPALVVNCILLGSIISEKSIPGTIRLALVNILIGLQVSILALLVILLQNVVYDIIHFTGSRDSLQNGPTELACRFSLFILSLGGSSRLVFMATLAVSVYVTVRIGRKKQALWKAGIASVFVWIYSSAVSWTAFSSEALDITIIGASTCSYQGKGAATVVITIGYTVLYGGLSLILTIVFCILTHMYWKKNTITEDRKALRRIALFATCLLIGNVFNSLGQSIPLFIGAYSSTSQEEFLEQAMTQTFVEGVLFLISFIPTPILILIYFKSVRKRFFSIIVKVARKRKSQVSDKGTTSSSLYNTKNIDTLHTHGLHLPQDFRQSLLVIPQDSQQTISKIESNNNSKSLQREQTESI